MESIINLRKNIILGIFILLAVVIMAGCNRDVDGPVTPGGADNPTDAVTATPKPTATPAPTATPTPTPSPTPTPVPRVQDVFDKTDDDGVYSKKAAFTDMGLSDMYYVGGRIIFSNIPREEYENEYVYGGSTRVVHASAATTPGASDSRQGVIPTADTGDVHADVDDGEDDDLYDDDDYYDDDWYGDDGYDSDYYENCTLYLYSVDPATWDTKEITLKGWNFYASVITPINNGTFALTQYNKEEVRIYDNMLNLLNTYTLEDMYLNGDYEIASDGSKLWYIKENALFCYDFATGEVKETDFLDVLTASYFPDNFGSSFGIVQAYEKVSYNNYNYYNLYFDTVTGEYLGRTDSWTKYIYSPDKKKAVRLNSGDGSTIEIYECTEDNYLPGEPGTDPETGEELPPSVEPVCKLNIENTSEVGSALIDWERNILITNVYYRGVLGGLYEYTAYSMIAGNKISNYVVDIASNKSLYYTFDPNEGLYYTDICDEDYNVNLTAWDYSTDTVREFPQSFRKFTDIPEAVEQKRRELEEKYGFYFYIGTEVFANDFDYDLTIYKDYDNVLQQMEVIDEVLSIYPEGFFEQFKYAGIKTLSIYLCGGFTKRAGESNTIEDAIALACVFGYERALALDLNWSYCLKRTIVHEISHWIDGRINSGGSLGGYADFEEDWLKYNPDDYTYKYSYVSGRTIWKYIYDSTGTNENTYFIDSYSQTYPTEDRARLFEYLMYNDDEEYSDYLAVPNLQNKLKFFFEAIRKGFDCSTWPEKTVWEEKLEEKIKAREQAEADAQAGDDAPADNTEP